MSVLVCNECMFSVSLTVTLCGPVVTISFCLNTNNIHPIAHPPGRYMGVFAWVQNIINSTMQYHSMTEECCARSMYHSRTWTSNYIPQILWDVITCPCPWYLLLVQHSSIYCAIYSESRRLYNAWWRHQMETFSALLALCAGNSPGTGEFPSQKASDVELWCFLWCVPE